MNQARSSISPGIPLRLKVADIRTLSPINPGSMSAESFFQAIHNTRKESLYVGVRGKTDLTYEQCGTLLLPNFMYKHETASRNLVRRKEGSTAIGNRVFQP